MQINFLCLFCKQRVNKKASTGGIPETQIMTFFSTDSHLVSYTINFLAIACSFFVKLHGELEKSFNLSSLTLSFLTILIILMLLVIPRCFESYFSHVPTKNTKIGLSHSCCTTLHTSLLSDLFKRDSLVW